MTQNDYLKYCEDGDTIRALGMFFKLDDYCVIANSPSIRKISLKSMRGSWLHNEVLLSYDEKMFDGFADFNRKLLKSRGVNIWQDENDRIHDQLSSLPTDEQ